MPTRNPCRRSISGIRSAIIAPIVPPILAMIFTLSGALTLVGPAFAQKPMCHAMGTRDILPPEKLPVPEKMSGIGNVHLKVTATPDAQIWFDQA